MNTPITVLFFGRPGAGKSSQLKLLEEHMNERSGLPVLPFSWSSVRDAFMNGNTHVQKRVEENHRSGKLQPPFLSVSLWGPALLKELTGKEHLLIDGVPRQHLEAHMFDSLLEFYEREPVYVFHFDAHEEVVRNRLAGRGDAQDVSQDAISERLGWYETDTLPLLDFFKQNPRYRVVDIDANQDKEEVLREVIKSIDT